MAYYSKNGSGIDSNAYIYVQLQVTRTDYPTYSHFSVKSVAVSDTGSSGFIRGQVTTNQGGTSWTASTGWKDVYYNGTTTLATATFDVTRGASDKTARIGAYAEGGGTGIYAGGTDYAWLNVTVPKVLAPNAPTGCTATYVSDSQASVSWTNGATDSDHPRDATLVERRDGSNDWAQVASASGTASGYTDNGISANGQYQYRVRAKNVAGYSAYSTSGSIYTTPAAPASVTLDKTAATTVQVDVTGTWGYAVTYDIESTYDGGSTWASVATSTSLPYSATVGAGTVRFRVRAVRGALASDWTLSASLVTVTPPLAPTIVSAPAGSIANGSTATVSWTPNHPDGSAQEAAQVKVTYPGGTSTTYSVTTATSWTSSALTANGTYTVQVRTKGLDPSYGEWSQTVSWGVANPPAVVITSPATDGTDIVALPLNVAWTVTDSTGVSTQRIIIEGDGGEILNRTLAGNVRTVALNASDVALEDGQTYTIRLRVMGGSGLVTEQTRIFDVAWLAPAAPVLQLTEGEGSSATIDVMDTRYSESGATIAVDGSAIADSFTVFGSSTQDGTPTPSAPVPIVSVADGGTLNVKTKDSADVTTTYPIDLQGNALRSLPDGTEDVLEVDGEGNVTLTKRVGMAVIDGVNVKARAITNYSPNVRAEITLPNQATVGFGDARLNTYADKFSVSSAPVNSPARPASEYTFELYSSYSFAVIPISALSAASADAVNEWFASNPVTVLYPLATPQEIDLGAVSDYPFIPDGGEMWVDGATMEAVLRPADYAGQPTIQSVDVQRVNADGTAWTVATGLTVGGSCIDPLPPLGVPVTYRATSSAASGSTASGEFTETFGGRDWVLNFGNAAQETIMLRYNPEASYSLTQGGTSYHFADGGAGGGRPVFYPTTDRDESGALKFATIGKDDADRLRALCDRYPVAWLRDPFGHRWRAHVKPSWSHGVGQLWPVGIDWDAVRWTEAWDG